MESRLQLLRRSASGGDQGAEKKQNFHGEIVRGPYIPQAPHYTSTMSLGVSPSRDSFGAKRALPLPSCQLLVFPQLARYSIAAR